MLTDLRVLGLHICVFHISQRLFLGIRFHLGSAGRVLVFPSRAPFWPKSEVGSLPLRNNWYFNCKSVDKCYPRKLLVILLIIAHDFCVPDILYSRVSIFTYFILWVWRCRISDRGVAVLTDFFEDFIFGAFATRSCTKTRLFPVSLHHFSCNNLRSAKRIFIKFDIGDFTALFPHISVTVNIS